MTVKGEKKFDYRYSIIPARAITDPRVCAQALRVLALLGRHTGDNGWCRRSQVKMAKELSCGRATVQRGLDELVAAGYVERRRETRTEFEVTEDDQPHTAHSYRVRLDLEDIDGQGGAHGRAPGTVPADGQVVPAIGGHAVPISRAPLTEPNPSKDTPLNSDAPVARESDVASLGQGAAESWPQARAAFADTWPDGFPADGESACRAEFEKITRIRSPEVIIGCIRAHGAALRDRKANRTGLPGPFAFKQPRNWLKQGDWQGYIPAVEHAASAETGETLALARVRNALGPKVVEKLKRVGVTDAELARFEGLVFEDEPPRFIAAKPFQASRLRDRGVKLQREFGEGLMIIEAGAERKCA